MPHVVLSVVPLPPLPASFPQFCPSNNRWFGSSLSLTYDLTHHLRGKFGWRMSLRPKLDIGLHDDLHLWRSPAPIIRTRSAFHRLPSASSSSTDQRGSRSPSPPEPKLWSIPIRRPLIVPSVTLTSHLLHLYLRIQFVSFHPASNRFGPLYHPGPPPTPAFEVVALAFR